MTEKAFAHWIEIIFETQEHEIDCKQFQTFLPSFVEAEVKGERLAHTAVLTAHLRQCPDCQEVHQGLLLVTQSELDEAWSSDAAGSAVSSLGD